MADVVPRSGQLRQNGTAPCPIDVAHHFACPLAPRDVVGRAVERPNVAVFQSRRQVQINRPGYDDHGGPAIGEGGGQIPSSVAAHRPAHKILARAIDAELAFDRVENGQGPRPSAESASQPAKMRLSRSSHCGKTTTNGNVSRRGVDLRPQPAHDLHPVVSPAGTRAVQIQDDGPIDLGRVGSRHGGSNSRLDLDSGPQRQGAPWPLWE